MNFGIFSFLYFLTSFVISNAGIILQMVGSWFVFRKMGMPGWKGIIPFYSTYVLFDKLWDTKTFWRMIIYLGVMIGATVFGFIFIMLGGVFLANGSNVAGIIFLINGIVMMIGSIVMAILMVVLEYRLYQRLAAAFGLKNGWAWGLLFVPFIMLPIIGFHKRIVYYGPVNQVPSY